MSEPTQEPHKPERAPRRGPLIPKRYVPYVAAFASACTFLGAELSTDMPWTPARYFTVAAAVLGIFTGGAVMMCR